MKKSTIIPLLAYLTIVLCSPPKNFINKKEKGLEKITLFMYENQSNLCLISSSEIGAELSEYENQKYIITAYSDGTYKLIGGGFEKLFDCDNDGLGDLSVYYSTRSKNIINADSIIIHNKNAVPKKLLYKIDDKVI